MKCHYEERSPEKSISSHQELRINRHSELFSLFWWRASSVSAMMDGTACLHKCVIINKDPHLAGRERVLHPTVNRKGVHPCAVGLISSRVGNKFPLRTSRSVCALTIRRMCLNNPNCAARFYEVTKTVGTSGRTWLTGLQFVLRENGPWLRKNGKIFEIKSQTQRCLYELFISTRIPSYWTTRCLAGSNHLFKGRRCNGSSGFEVLSLRETVTQTELGLILKIFQSTVSL